MKLLATCRRLRTPSSSSSTRSTLLFLFLVSLCLPTSLAWNTLYDFQGGKTYLHLSNNDLVSLPLRSDLPASTEPDVLASPQLGSTLVVCEGALYAFYNASGYLAADRLNSEGSKWQQVVTSTEEFYANATYFAPASGHSIYIYGGVAPDGGISDRLLAVDAETFGTSQVASSAHPAPFYGAAASPVSAVSVVLIGGRSTHGWVALTQLAVMDYNSWTFRGVSEAAAETDGLVIDARTGALALPLFTSFTSSGAVDSGNVTVDVASVLVLGGEVVGRVAYPEMVQLRFDKSTGTWRWGLPDAETPPDVAQILGATTIFGTLVTIEAQQKNNKAGRLTKRGAALTYSLKMYDSSDWQPVQAVAPVELPTSLTELQATTISTAHTETQILTATATATATASASAETSSHGSGKSTVAVASSVPVAVALLIAGCVAAWLIWKRKSATAVPSAAAQDFETWARSSAGGSGKTLFLDDDGESLRNPALGIDVASIPHPEMEMSEVAKPQSSPTRLVDLPTALPQNSVIDPFSDENAIAEAEAEGETEAETETVAEAEAALHDKEILLVGTRPRRALRVTNPDETE